MKSFAKTTLLLGLLTGLFLAVGYMLGGQTGAIMALVMAVLMNFGMYWFSGSMVLKMQGATPLDTAQYPYFEKAVRELTTKDGLPMPKLYFVDTPVPNAFATGRNPSHAVVAVTRGITEILNERELRAVIAHELGHVKNYDMLVSTIAAAVGGAVSILAQMSLFAGGGDEDSPNPIAAMAMFLLAPLAAMLIQMAVSRSREFGADEHGAHLVGQGSDLASALQKLEDFKPNMARLQPSPNQEATNHLMFTNMFNMRGLSSLFSTHPSTAARIARLQKLR